MAENPVTWNETVKLINAALDEHRKLTEAGVCGYTLPRYIYNVLLNAGKLKEPVE